MKLLVVLITGIRDESQVSTLKEELKVFLAARSPESQIAVSSLLGPGSLKRNRDGWHVLFHDSFTVMMLKKSSSSDSTTASSLPMPTTCLSEESLTTPCLSTGKSTPSLQWLRRLLRERKRKVLEKDWGS